MKKTLLVFGMALVGLTRVNQVEAVPAQSPLRFRLNKNVIKKIISLHDQDVFNVFRDVEVEKVDELEHTSKIVFSLKPQGVDHDDFDFNVSIDKEYLGAESDKVTVVGTVTLKDGTEVPFTAPVPLVKLQYALGTKFNKDYEIDQWNFDQKEWTFKTGSVSGEGLTAEASEEIGKAIDKHIDDFKKKFEKGDKQGEMPYIKDFPMDTVIPMAGLFYASQIAEKVEFDDNFATYGFGLGHWKMITEKQNKMLKEIKHEFYNDTNKDGYPALI